jgi:hypothetical protein
MNATRKCPLEKWRLKGKKRVEVVQTTFSIYSGICLQLTARESKQNSYDVFTKSIEFWFQPITFDSLQLDFNGRKISKKIYQDL